MGHWFGLYCSVSHYWMFQVIHCIGCFQDWSGYPVTNPLTYPDTFQLWLYGTADNRKLVYFVLHFVAVIEALGITYECANYLPKLMFKTRLCSRTGFTIRYIYLLTKIWLVAGVVNHLLDISFGPCQHNYKHSHMYRSINLPKRDQYHKTASVGVL